MHAWRWLLAGATGSIGLVIAVALLAPATAERTGIAYWGQSLAEAGGAVACAVAAVHTRAHARAVWLLFASGLAVWALTDAAAAVISAGGGEVPEVSVLDIGWLAFYAPMLTGVLILYRRLRPERGWQGLIDGLIGTIAVGTLAWTTLLGPLAAESDDGVVGSLVALLYPALDLCCLAALGWILLRHGARTPSWLRWVVSAFALQAVAGLAYVASALHGEGIAVVAAACFIGAGWCWIGAGLARRRAPQRTWAAGTHDAPPVWSQRLPFALGVGVVVLGAAHPRVELRVAAVAAAALMAARAVEALGVSRALLSERDRLLVTDPLTGAFNRRFLADESNRALSRDRRAGKSLSLIALDLDRFKEVNDRLGHEVGDRLLRQVAAVIGQQLRGSDVLFRLGGDEFLVLCPGTGADGALVVAERLRHAVRESAAALVPALGVTASLGVAAFPGDGDDLASLMRAADGALYASKGGGRDRSTRYAPAPPALVTG